MLGARLNARSVVVSIFKNTANPQVAALRTGTWEAFADTFREPLPAATSKGELPLWAPADFKGGHRNIDNVTAVFALTLDVDEDPIPDAHELKRAFFGLRAVCYSSPSATASAPRWRAAVALSRPVTGEEYSRLWAYLTPRLPFRVGQASKDPSRQWYSACEGADGSYDFISLTGAALDVDDLLECAPEVDIVQNTIVAPTVASAPSSIARDAAASLLGTAWPVRGRHQAQLALAGALCREGWSQGAATDFLCAVCRHAGDEDRPKREKTTADAYRRAQTGAKTQGWTSLAAHVGGGVVDEVRALFNPHENAQKDFLKEISCLAEIIQKNSRNTESLKKEIGEPSFSFVTAVDLSKPLPPVTYVVKHFGISPGRPSLLAGYGGLGKTVVAQLLALHMAAGVENCWGLPIATGAVRHFDYEMTQDPLQRRYQRLAVGHGIELASCDLQLSSMPSIYLSDDAAESALCRATEGALFAIMDNLAAATASSLTKENESGIRKYLDRLTRVTSKTGCTFWVLAHERKASKEEGGSGLQRVRGSSAITDACGSVVSISVAPGTGVMSLSHNKSSRKKGDDLHLKIVDCCFEQATGVPEEDSPGLRVERVDTKAKDAAAETEKRVTQQATLIRIKNDMLAQLRLPACSGGFPKTDLLNLVSGSNDPKRQALSELLRDGLTVEFDSSRKSMVMLNPANLTRI